MYHHLRELDQFTPARAKKAIDICELSRMSGSIFTEQKIDGERFILHTHKPTMSFLHAVTSRHISVKTNRFVEKTDRVPHITNHPQLPYYSKFDTEFVSSGDIVLIDLPGKFWDKLVEPQHPHILWLQHKFSGALPVYPSVANTTSIMGSLAHEAIRKQEERGKIWSYCFDILEYQNKSALGMIQRERRKALATIMESINPEYGLILMPAWDLSLDLIDELYYRITDYPVRGEGLILKDLFQIYNGPRNWWKLKRNYPADCIITGRYKIGEEGKTGQMLGMVSSLEIGVYKGKDLLPIGWISGILDGLHNLVTPEIADIEYKGKVVEVRHNGLQDDPDSEIGKSLRHPRFRRWRNDKNDFDCKLEYVIEECKKGRE